MGMTMLMRVIMVMVVIMIMAMPVLVPVAAVSDVVMMVGVASAPANSRRFSRASSLAATSAPGAKRVVTWAKAWVRITEAITFWSTERGT